MVGYPNKTAAERTKEYIHPAATFVQSWGWGGGGGLWGGRVTSSILEVKNCVH